MKRSKHLSGDSASFKMQKAWKKGGNVGLLVRFNDPISYSVKVFKQTTGCETQTQLAASPVEYNSICGGASFFSLHVQT